MVNKFTLNTVEAYRLESEAEVEMFYEELKEDTRFELAAFSATKKEDKKEEREYFVVKVKKVFNTEKRIVNRYIPNYEEPEFKTTF